MSKRFDDITIKDVIEKARTYIDDEEKIKIIEKAYQFASKKHEGEFRKSGEAYIYHPLNVAMILTTVYADYETLAAGLLHDILADDISTVEELEKRFSTSICNLVKGVNKISNINFSTDNDYLIEYYKKIIVGMSEDVRVIIIKLADRLHNMRTLWALSEERQKIKARESLEIFAPIADHLGIHKIKSELEDLALRYLKPDVFYDIVEKLNKTKIERDRIVYDMQTDITNILNENHIPHEIKGRSKSIYSIYNKLNKGKKFSDIYDLLALRVLVNTEQECYLVLGLIHSKYRPLPNRFKDYIAMPKPNMYQSLHTTVFGIEGYLFEVQIRTYDMDEVAENGIAAHWSYKEQGSKNIATINTTTEQKLQFFKSIIDLSKDKMSNEDFINSIKEEMTNNNNIYCFTPKGDVIELPKGATPLDFAYRIHSKIGETTVGAIVNNNIVPLDYELKDNDIVKINTNKSSTPSKEWLNMVKCSTTKNKIKAFFTKSEREVYIERGKYTLEKELRKKKIPFQEFMSDENTKKILEYNNVDDFDEIYLYIGNGKITVNSVINVIYKENVIVPKVVKIPSKPKDISINVDNIQNVKVNLANCCNPVYGDEIVGYITKGNGISIHRINCHNLDNMDDRTVNVFWNETQDKKYLSTLLVYSKEIDNHISDLLQVISMMNISVDGYKVMNKGEKLIYEISCLVTGIDQLNKVILNIEKNHYVDKVERAMK